jgi:hypothetical protein
MSRQGKDSGGTGDKGGDHDDYVMEFRPEGAFNIKTAAHNLASMMEESNHPLVIHLPHVSVEFEPGCTPQEIIDGYNLAMKHKVVVHHSNANAPQPKR